MPRCLGRSAGSLLASLILALGLVGCDIAPGPPLLSPLSVARFYGYTDVQRGDVQYVVTYLGPSRMTSRIPAERESDTAAARTFAMDLALWRAAQIAEQRGFPAFRVTQSRLDADIRTDQTYDERYADPWPYRGPYWRRPNDPFPPAYYRSTTVTIQPRASLDITLQKVAAPGDYAVSEVFRQVRQTYPGAEGPLATP